ncbi:arginine deiminase [Limnochorda pilosa]|uniref:arginine deiminase n=1 Tax=Limnochorda pilosa TaxID=1555112 RepID=A0A0K2SNY7_LIMPI|nr:arginine deiminase [Limnochorda pilosa]BAS28544.1 arginine deiminase [Limnochorda pilosa]
MKVESEVGRLQAVLLHRPGPELENLVPRDLERLLFEEIPWLPQARREHAGFARQLEALGVHVYYVEDLLRDLARDPELREEMVESQLEASRLRRDPARAAVRRCLLEEVPPEELPDRLIAGITKEAVRRWKQTPSLSDLTAPLNPFYLDPLPSMYFTRDHGAMIGPNLLVSQMTHRARRRETAFLRTLLRHHPLFQGVKAWWEEPLPTGIEGGDILAVAPSALVLGLSERTSEAAIEVVAERLFAAGALREILVLQIPSRRAFMHLDTVFTMVDRERFLIYPGIEERLRLFRLAFDDGRVRAEETTDLARSLARLVGVDRVELLRSGGDDPITAAREQWADSTNVLAVAPGQVIAYDRNEATNRTLQRAGIEVLEIEGSELVRGRGGPRCMSLPLDRLPLG